MMSTNDKVVALFDPSRPRHERVPTERNQPSGVTPIFDPTSMLLAKGRVALEDAKAAARAQASNVTPMFDPQTQKIVTLRAIIAEMDSWVPLSAHRSATTEPR
jgi:hypothetical protein